MNKPASAAGIAVVHSLFNIGCAIVLYPFSNILVKLAMITIPEGKSNKEIHKKIEVLNNPITLDERFLERPAFAMEICRNTTGKMADEVQIAINMALDLLFEYNEEKAKQVITYEQRTDEYEDALGTYLVKLSGKNLSKKDSQTMSVLLHSISDFERISDHAINLQETAVKIKQKELKFSDTARRELEVMIKAVRDIVHMTVDVFKSENLEKAVSVEPLEEVIDRLNKEIKQRHVKRLRKEECTIELGLLLEDVLTILERISDHCSNVAVAMIEIHDDEFDTHAYFEELNKGEGSRFYEEYIFYEKKYLLPVKDEKSKDR
jgi:phosphate:Na+ symporter